MARLWDIGRSEPIKVGKASPTEGTLPGSIYFILKYANKEDGLKKALQANAMVGGDNASRAIAIGMVLGAYFGVEAIPQEWKETLTQWEYCENLLNKLPLIKKLKEA
jgi:ADP-ribosylglycohydrolase